MPKGGNIIKSRKQKAAIYESNYKDIPRDYQERLDWMYDHYHLTLSKSAQIVRQRDNMLNALRFSPDIYIVLYEEPEGSPRPRARYINKSNLVANAVANPGFIQIYSLTGKSDRDHMKRLISDDDFTNLNGLLIYTPCSVDYSAYIKTPAGFNVVDTYLAELGLIRPICKPDFDNIEKKYSDMYNGNVWVDDALVIDSAVHKYYSILPRVEIHLKFLNMLYNKYQYKQMCTRLPDRDDIRFFHTDS